MTDSNFKELLVQIEKVREQMHDLSKEVPLSDPQIVEISQKLDLLLNELDRLKNKD